MTEQLVGASTRMAQNFLDATEKALAESDGKSSPSET
jgi:tellurite resistance protein